MWAASGLLRAYDRPALALLGGTQGWEAAGLAVEAGGDSILTGDDDTWSSPYAHADEAERHRQFRAYLQWELDLVEQLRREGDTGIRLVRPAHLPVERAA